MIMDVCTNPDMLKVMLYVNVLVTIAKVLLPLIVIYMGMKDLMRVGFSGDPKVFKEAMKSLAYRCIEAALIFFLPSILNAIFGTFSNIDFMSCITNVTSEKVEEAYIREAENAVTLTERSLDMADYNNAYYYVSQISSDTTKENYLTRLDSAKKTIQDKNKTEFNITSKENIMAGSTYYQSVSAAGNLSISGSYSSSGNGICKKGIAMTSEPDPSAALTCWPEVINKNNFTFPKDDKTGLPLGAWPSNYASIPTQLTSYNVRGGGFIVPITPENGQYNYAYEHNGIDLMADFGTPVYSPVDGELIYSTWGHTVNKGGDETAYTVTINMATPFTYGGVTINTVFLTHMSGIVYRCDSTSQCNMNVKKGQLIGFSGNASGSATSPGWAPHLHMTLYNLGNYDGGLRTTKIQELYGISSGMSLKAGA